MEMIMLDMDFSVCKLHDWKDVYLNQDFVFLSKTDEEISLVCEARFVPKDAIAVEKGWKALKIDGILDFGMVGVISKIANVLSQANISVFVVSTYNTDYVFLKAADYEKGVSLLKYNGYILKDN